MLKRCVLTAAAFLFVCSSATAQLLDSPWPKIHKDVKNSGYSSNTGTKTGKLKWQYSVDNNKEITSSPVLDNNGRIYFGSADTKIYCLDRETGDLIWSYTTGDAIENSSGAIDANNILYIGSTDGYLYAFDLDNIPNPPTYLWRYQTNGGITGSPTIASDGTVIFGSTDGFVYALSPTAPGDAGYPNPNLKWVSNDGVNPISLGVIWSTPTIDDIYYSRYNPNPNGDGTGGPIVIIGSADPEQAVGIVPNTIGDGIPCDDDIAYRWSGLIEDRQYNNIFILDLETGELLFDGLHTVDPDAIYGSIGIRQNGKLIIPFETAGAIVDHLDVTVDVYSSGSGGVGDPCIATQELAPHEYEAPEGSGRIYGTPAVLPEASYYIGWGTILYRFYPSTSDYFSYTMAGQIESSPAVDETFNAYVGCNGGVFYCINSLAPNKPLRWKYPETGILVKTLPDGSEVAAEIISSPAIDNDNKHSIYVGASNGVMYAFYDGPSIKGTITTDGVTPMPLCDVNLYSSGGTFIEKVTTDVLGNYEFFGQESGQYIVIPKKFGMVFSPSQAVVNLGDVDARADFIAALSFTITGQVVRASDGVGMPNVSMALVTRNASGQLVDSNYTVTTDANGDYTFTDVGFGTTEITPSLTGWGFSPSSIFQNIPTGTAGGQVFTLDDFEGTQGYQVSGLVTDAATGSALAGVTMRIEGPSSFTPVEVTTNTQGAYSFTGLFNGTYSVTPTLTDYTFQPISLTVVVNNANVINQNFTGTAAGVEVGGLMRSPWPKIHRDVKNSGYTSNVGTAIGKIKWTYVTEKPITSSPALDNSNRIYFGSADKNLYCLDRTTGGLIWKYETGDAIIHSSPALDVDGILYIGSSDGYLYAFDTVNVDVANPQPLWTFATNDGISGSPSIANDGTIIFGSSDGYLYALNPTTPPTVKWQVKLGIMWATPTLDYVYPTIPPNYWYTSSPVVMMGATQHTGQVGVKDAPDGSLCQKEYDAQKMVGSSFYALDLESGSVMAYGLRQTNWPGSALYGSIGIQPGGNYIFPFEESGMGVGNIGAVSVLSGEGCTLIPDTEDSLGYFSGSGFIYATPTVHPTGFFYLGQGETLYRVDPSLSNYFSYEAAGRIESSVALDGNGNAYFGCNGGVFYCINSNSPGQPLRWKYPETGNLVKPNGDAAEIISSPAVDNDAKHSIYFGASDGIMYAFYDGAVITGNITATDGTTPLASVEVTLKDADGNMVLVTSTDTLGNFKFSGISSGQYTVVPKKDGYIFNPVSAPVTLTNVDAYVEFTADLSFTVTGRIVDSQTGAGMYNIAVELVTQDANGTVVYSDTTKATDIDGYYTFNNIGYGTTIVTPSQAGYSFDPSSVVQEIPVGTAGGAAFTLVDIEAAQGYQISGRILTASTNAPIAGVAVTLTGTPNGESAIAPVTIATDANGLYSFIGLANGTYTVTPSSGVYKFESSTGAASATGTITDANWLNVNFIGTPGNYFILTGSVVNAADDSPIPDVALLVQTRNTAGTVIYTDDTVTTAGDGSYTISNIPAGITTVTPTLSGWGFNPPSVSQNIPTGTTGGTTYTLTTMRGTLGFQISGAVTDINRPNDADNGIEGVTLTLSGTLADGSEFTAQTTQTDATGTYSFTGIANGQYTVTPSLAGYKFDITSQDVTVEDASVTDIDFQGGQGVKITGTVRLPDDETSYEGFSVKLYLDDETIWSKIFNPDRERTLVATQAVKDTGSFTFIVSAGKYIVEPAATGYSFDPESRNVTAALTDISGLVFTASSGLSISGRITTILGIPQSGITVQLEGVTVTATDTATSGTDGTYTFVGVEPGTYTVAPEESITYTATPSSRTVTIEDTKVTKVNFTVVSFCTKTLLALPPFGTTGSVVGIIGLNYGVTPGEDAASTTVTLPDGTTTSKAPGVYFGTADPETWVQATVSSWTPFYITAEVPPLADRLVRIWVVRAGSSSCINSSIANIFINTNP